MKTTKQIAQEIRNTLKMEFPNCKFSVTCKYFSGGSEIKVNLMESNIQVFESLENVKKLAELGKIRGDQLKIENLIKHHEYCINHGNAQLNHYQLLSSWKIEQNEKICNGVMLTQEGWDLLKRIAQISLKDHYDRSDPQTDYFDCNYYFHLEVGKWDKPYIQGR